MLGGGGLENEVFWIGMTPWHWKLREKERLGVWRSTCSAFPSEPVPCKGIPRAAFGKTQRIRFRKPASREEFIFLLKPWTRGYEGALREEVLTLPMYL